MPPGPVGWAPRGRPARAPVIATGNGAGKARAPARRRPPRSVWRLEVVDQPASWRTTSATASTMHASHSHRASDTIFLLTLNRRGGREWSGRRKSELLTWSVCPLAFQSPPRHPPGVLEQHPAKRLQATQVWTRPASRRGLLAAGLQLALLEPPHGEPVGVHAARREGSRCRAAPGQAERTGVGGMGSRCARRL